MRVEDETELSKALLGDSEARRALALRRAASPELAVELDRYERAWERLELAPPAPVPAGFAARTAAAVAAETAEMAAESSLLPGFTLSPAWAGFAAAALVAFGVLGGAGLGLYALPTADTAETTGVVDEAEIWADDGLLDEQLFDSDADADSDSALDDGGGSSEAAGGLAP